MQFENPFMRTVRRTLRAVGLAGPLSRLLLGRGYEQRFDAKLTENIQAGDIIWDVGANVGYYSGQFSRLCSPGGHVYAFEPSPINSVLLQKEVAGLENVTVVQIALSDRSGTIMFEQGADELGATSRVLYTANKDYHAGSVIEIGVASGEELVNNRGFLLPNVIKIDVEGHELEVLLGMKAFLERPNLKHVFVEVHFSLLESLGRSNVPGEIVRLMSTAGFGVEWVDPSHLHAFKAR